MATHTVKVREDLLQKLITLSQETGKPMSELIGEVLLACAAAMLYA